MNSHDRLALVLQELGKASVAFMRQSKDVVMPTDELTETGQAIERLWSDEIAAKDAEIARLRKLIDDAGAPWIRLAPGVPWEGAIDAAMASACAEIAELRADLVWAIGAGVRDWGSYLEWRVSFDGFVRLTQQTNHDGTPESICRAVREARNGG